jgi:NDP-sugar pyrophosphorylase family protein
LIKVDDETILDHQIDSLSKAGIDEISIVVGYEKQQIIRHVRRRFGRRTQKSISLKIRSLSY